MSAFDGDAELHVPVPYDNTDEVHPDATQHAWLDFVRSSYPKFLASEDFDQAAELELFDRRIGQFANRRRSVNEILLTIGHHQRAGVRRRENESSRCRPRSTSSKSS